MLFKSHRYGPRSCHLASVGGLAQTARLCAAHRNHAGQDKLRTEMSAVRGQGARAADRHAGPRDAKQTDQVRRHSRQWVASVIDTFRTPPGKSLRAELSPTLAAPRTLVLRLDVANRKGLRSKPFLVLVVIHGGDFFLSKLRNLART